MKAIKKYFSGLVMAVSLLTVNSVLAANDVKPVFFPGGNLPAKVQFLTTINGENFFNNTSMYGNRFPGYVPPTNINDQTPFLSATGIASYKEQMLICDVMKNQVNVLNFKTKLVSKLDYKFKGARSVTIDADGTRYIVDEGRIVVFNAQNKFVRTFKYSEAWTPVDAAIVGENIYVIDAIKDQIIVLNKVSGDFVRAFGQNGEAVGDFDSASSIKSDSNGVLYVSNTMNGRIDTFNVEGKFLGKYGTEPNVATGNFARPQGIALDKEGRLYVVDNSFENVQIFNSNKQFLLPFGLVGNTPGGLNMPYAISVDYDNAAYFSKFVAPGHTLDYVILVANQTGDHKVSVFGLLK